MWTSGLGFQDDTTPLQQDLDAWKHRVGYADNAKIRDCKSVVHLTHHAEDGRLEQANSTSPVAVLIDNSPSCDHRGDSCCQDDWDEQARSRAHINVATSMSGFLAVPTASVASRAAQTSTNRNQIDEQNQIFSENQESNKAPKAPTASILKIHDAQEDVGTRGAGAVGGGVEPETT